MNKNQTTLLLQILDNQIADYDKAIGQMERKVGATVPGSMRIKDRKSRREKIKELKVAVINLDADIRLKQAEAQLIGFFHRDQNGTVGELTTVMGLTVDEYRELRKGNTVMVMKLEARLRG